MRSSLAICLAVFFAPTIAAAQVAPKLCVAVARDPDTTTRSIAERIHDLAARTTTVRTVGDDQARGALRGELPATAQDPTLVALARQRRALSFNDADAQPLTAIADALGCAQIAVVSATPRGISLRRFDVLASRYDAATEATTYSDSVLSSRFGLPDAATTTTAASTTATASTTTTTTNTANTTTTTNGASTAQSSSTNSAATTPSTSTTPARNTANSAPTRTTTSRATTTPDPRVTVGPTTPPARSTPVWAWVVAGVAGAGLVGAFIAAQTIGPSVPLVRVSGPGTAP
ncbi:MAG: hypothetical protein JNK05_18955 [Myxococcales bacterium]|nr:hypothetical protein [Myxococcales bacterium]